MISGERFAERVRVISELRDLTLGLKYSALEAYKRGELPIKPRLDIRSDYEYWKRLSDQKKRRAD